MEILRAIVVDDELSSLQNLQQKLLEFCPGIQVVATSRRPEDAIQLIRQHCPDVLFLDIEMPRIDGFKLLELLGEIDFEIIFVTAYNQYAIEAIRISAFDYLVKPVVIKELEATVQRLAGKSRQKTREKFENLRQRLAELKTQEQTIPIPVNDGIDFLQIKEIIRIESSSNYSRIVLANGKTIVVAKLLKEFEDMLSNYRFCRVHNSHLINLVFISKYIRGDGGQIVMRNGDTVDVSRRKKEDFLRLMSFTG